MNNGNGLLAGTTGGTLTIIVANIEGNDLVKTVLLAAIGAIVSFSVSYLLRRWFRKQ